jgi:hypothetical protein
VEKLKTRYIDAASDHGRATEAGDYKTANRSARRLATLHKQFLAQGEQGTKALVSLMTHKEPSVRYWAAYHSRSFAPKEAEVTLLEIANAKGGLVSFSARITLEEWQKGLPRSRRRDP